MKEMMQKIIDKVGTKALISANAFEKAAAELGYSKEEIMAAVQEFDGFPLDDDDLMDVVGGIGGQNDYVNSTVGHNVYPYVNSTVGSVFLLHND